MKREKKIKRRNIKIVVLIAIGKKLYPVILSKEEKDCVVSTISLMQNGNIKVFDKAIEGVEYSK